MGKIILVKIVIKFLLTCYSDSNLYVKEFFTLYNYFNTLKKHGLKLTLTMLLGNLVTSLIFTGTLILLAILGGLAIAIGGVALQLERQFEQLGDISLEALPEVLATVFASPSFLIFMLLFFLLLFAVSFAINGFQTAGSVAVTKEALTENRTDIRSFFTNGFQFIGKMTGVLFLSSLPYLLPIGLFFAAITLLTTGYIVVGLLLLLTGLVLAVAIAMALMHAPIILIAEKTGVTRAISLSFYLFRKAFTRVFGSAFYSFLIYLGFFTLTGSLLSFLFAAPERVTTSFPGSTTLDILLTMLSMFGGLPELILQLVLSTVLTMLTLLLIIYRYYQYLRIYIHPNGTEEPATHPESTEPSSALDENDASASNPDDSSSQ
jgi:hypothetical protein